MEKLEKLYACMKGLQELGLPLDEKTQSAADELEEQLIQNEILPAVMKSIEPRIAQIQRELALVVEYKPGLPISVSLSRKTNAGELLDAKPLQLAGQCEAAALEESDEPVEQKKSRKILRVTFLDGTIIQEAKAKDTFVEAIKKIGLQRVHDLDVKFNNSSIVSKVLNEKYMKDTVEMDGWYIMTHSNTQDKKSKLEKISWALKLGLKVEMI